MAKGNPRYRDDAQAAAQKNADRIKKAAAEAYAEVGGPEDTGAADLLKRAKAKRQSVAGPAGRSGSTRTLPPSAPKKPSK